MIKNILLICFNLIMVVLIVICVTKGLTISDNFSVLSYKQLGEKEVECYKITEERDRIVANSYNSAIKDLKMSQEKFQQSQQKYEQIKNMSSYDELVQLSRDVEYRIESLWIKLDLPAKNNNLVANFQLQNVMQNVYNINVTLEGDYLSMKNYIYDIMIDMDLQFKAENIIIEGSGDTGKATFQIKNVKILM